ncbi:phosphoglucosamine mutase [Methanobrevibacter sp.]
MASVGKKLFGTSGIRGEIGSEVTSELALNVGKSLGYYLGGEGTVVLGYDTRTTSKMLEHAITAGLVESGIDVIKIGMVPTPLVGYTTEKLSADAGVMITASHNPSKYNGIKLWNNNAMAYTPEQEKTIEDIYLNKKYENVSWDRIGSIEENNEIQETYIEDLLTMVNIEPGFKVVIDCASGAGSELSPILFRRAGCDVITLNSQVDGFFPGRNPEPNDANLTSLKKVVKATGANLGIAHDGDADRMMAVDETGKVVDFDKLLALMAAEFGGTVVTTVDAGLVMDVELEKVGGKVLRTPVGDVAVADAIIKNNASFGGEPSGTWLYPDFCMCPDGLLSGIRLANIVSHKGPLSKLLSKMDDYPNIREKVTCSTEEKAIIMENMEEEMKNAFDDIKEVNNIDGVRLSLNDGSWVLVRPSGTENYIRITLESPDEDKANEMKEICVDLIKSHIS